MFSNTIKPRRSMQKYDKLNMLFFSAIVFMLMLRRYIKIIFPDSSKIMVVAPLLFYVPVLLLLVRFIIQKRHNKTEICLLILSCILYVANREGVIMIMILLASMARDIDDEYIVRNYVLMTLVLIILGMFVANIFPFLTKDAESHYRITESAYILRETFGFFNPNMMFIFTLAIFAGYIFLRYENYNRIDRIILLALTVFIYLTTKSRTGLVSIVAGLIVVEVLKRIDLRRNKAARILVESMPVILLVVSMGLGVFFAKNTAMNDLLSSRPRYWSVYLSEHYSLFNLFGHKFSDAIKLENPLDSSYIFIYAMLGIVSLIFVLYLIIRGLHILVEQGKTKYIAIVLLYLLFAFSENVLLEVAYNFTLIILVKYVIDSDRHDFEVRGLIRK
ncbi:MAG: polysaccharide polymerase [Clostridioides sp.]|jgi:hypothetical protein|nr:polysaccharide polymerase [Clostridioides sp.]